MNIKKKLILIGICMVIILLVFTANVIRRMKAEPEKEPEIIVNENVISRAEAYRLLSYLEYDKAERESIPVGTQYSDQNMSGWYDTFVNAVWKMGLIEGKITVNPQEALTYGDCKDLIDKLILEKSEYKDIYSGLSFDFMKAEDEMQIPDFLELYNAILSATPKESNPIKEATLLVLDREVSEDGKDRMVTDQGKYYYLNAKDYESYYKQMEEPQVNTGENTTKEDSETEETLSKNSIDASEQGAATDIAADSEASDSETAETLENDVVNEEAVSITYDRITNLYQDKGIKVLACGQEIVYITAVTTDKIVLHNVWIKSGEGVNVDTFVSGINKIFSAKAPLENAIEKVVGDITIENQKVVQISVKPDMINGKVLQTGDNFIEIEGYGKVPLDNNYKIYKIYGELSLEPTDSILVGYETTDFVVSDGKISAALITKSIKAENIRVLLKTTDFESIFHDKVEFTSDTDFTVSTKDKETSYIAGETVTIKPGDDMLADGRIKVKSASGEGKIQLLSITRSSKNPKYRGTIEISEGDEGLLVVNELPLEEYLYAVIPSEMPTYYGIVPLKVQAVCARSYAYKHLLANSLSEYGAHVDDSVSYQVYNNIAENEDSILAVKDTYGKVIEYNGDVITAYYFSTSCGHTTGVQSVWANGEETPYLSGILMATEAEVEGTKEQIKEVNTYKDLSDEDVFRAFINEKDFVTYDSEFDWYRWKVTINAEDIKSNIDNNLANRYNANPELIQTMTSAKKGDKEAVYESIPVDTVGDIEDISVLKRDSGGIIEELLIKGSENTIKVKTEYNIRVLMAPTNSTVTRQDDSEVGDLSLLPSAFFIIDKNEEDGKLSSFTLTGGGYGHGVGMSQNGVKALSDEGKDYEEIVKYFYQGTELGFIYE